MNKKTTSLIILIVLILSLLTGCTSSDKKEKDENASYGEDFSFTLLNGKTKKTSDYQGKILLIDFMGVYCEPCRDMMNVLRQLHLNYPEVEFVSIDVWIALGETPELLQNFVNTNSLDWTFGYDDTSGTLYTEYTGQQGIPLIILLDENGNIYYTKPGYINGYTDYTMLSEKIEELI